MTSIASSLSMAEAADHTWDALIIGAGPAGVLAAHQLAVAGANVLLVDKATFPRPKVCGGCLNGTALATLNSCGLGPTLDACGGTPLHGADLACRGRSVALALPAGLALTRRTLDAAMIRAAVAHDAHFLSGVRATVGLCEPTRRIVHLSATDVEVSCAARVVLVADGLDGRSLNNLEGFDVVTARAPRVGCGITLDDGPAEYAAGTIYMSIGAGGYAGIVRAERGRVLLGAALDPDVVRDRCGAGAAIAAILQEAGRPPIPQITEIALRGTATLRRYRRRIADPRLLVIGDATGYVEPFTGEGMAWAVGTAARAVPLVLEALADDTVDLAHRWPREHRHVVRRRQLTCRMVAWGLRRPRLTRLALRAVAAAPALAQPYVKKLNRPVVSG